VDGTIRSGVILPGLLPFVTRLMNQLRVLDGVTLGRIQSMKMTVFRRQPLAAKRANPFLFDPLFSLKLPTKPRFAPFVVIQFFPKLSAISEEQLWIIAAQLEQSQANRFEQPIYCIEFVGREISIRQSAS
jgi:hypothetical protein